MKRILLFIISCLISNFIFSQCNGRYQTEIFNTFTITTTNYSDVYTDNAHEMDIYIPDDDTVTNRPLIIFLHGGSFLGGDKESIECVDFCKNFVKKGYITASANYRIAADANAFALYQEEQYKTVLKVVSDIKGAIRYFSKSIANGNPYGIDENAIFIGGASAGAVAALHLAYIDNLSDLPTSVTEPVFGNIFNVQSLVSAIGGDLEGNAGNNGFSSEINGVISFAGGINDISWIDSNDEPLVSCQGDNDVTVNYNCGPGLGYPTVLQLCGSAQMHQQADIVSIINSKLIFSNANHDWCSAGISDPKFIQALDFTKDFLYPLLPCNNTTNVNELAIEKKQLKVIDVLGRNSKIQSNTPQFYIYSDGSIEYKIIID